MGKERMMRMTCAMVVILAMVASVHGGEAKPIFDGKTFDGWEGDTKTTFRIEDGAVVGGTLKDKIPHNAFLCTTREYTNFVLRLECKLIGAGANAGIQIRSQRVPNHHEMIGYQADMDMSAGSGYWGCLYDESRRKKFLAKTEDSANKTFVKKNDWNVYEIRCEGKNIKLSVNGVQTVDFTETEENIMKTRDSFFDNAKFKIGRASCRERV